MIAVYASVINVDTSKNSCVQQQCNICSNRCSVGPAEEEQKVYLSPATLLVLPPTLIPHWLHQIRVHMKPNTLRVAVLATERGSPDDASSGLHPAGYLLATCTLCMLRHERVLVFASDKRVS